MIMTLKQYWYKIFLFLSTKKPKNSEEKKKFTKF